ncbi:MAG: cell division protein FtsQ/DivIB [Candidatus Paceibacterales bacterium]
MRKYRRRLYRVKKKKSIFYNRFFWLGLLFVVFIIAISYFLFFSEIFQVERTIVTGEKKVSKEELKALIEKRLENKILFLRTKSIFLVNLDEIRKDILNNFPQIAEVEISRGFPDALNILVVERFAEAYWCQGGQCFLLDNEGIIFEEVSEDNLKLLKIILRQAQDNAELSRSIKSSNLKDKLELGEKIIEKELLSKVLEIFSELENSKILVEEVSIVSEERINVKTSDGWEIYFNPKKDLNWQLTKLRAVLEKYIPLEKRKDLEYIELRFGDLAPFKYRE